MRPHSRCFDRFKERLLPEECSAVKGWLNNISHEIIRDFQIDGSVPHGRTFQQIEAFERHFSSALAKAVVCKETVFRGLSAGGCFFDAGTGSMNFLRCLIDGPEEIIFPSHASASLSEEIGRGHCHIDPEDQPRRLSVLLRIQPRTARYLAPYTHKPKDEEEVVILKGTPYRRTNRRRLPDPKPGLEYWEVELVEEGGDSIA